MSIILSKVLGGLVLTDEVTILQALRHLELTKKRVVVLVDQDGCLVGTLSDGDFRRWIVNTSLPNLDAMAAEVANRFCVSVGKDASADDVARLFVPGVEVIPVLDKRRRVESLAFARSRGMTIAGRRIAQASPTFVIAEIGINHNGDMATGRQLVRAAADAGADCAKFQMRDMASLYRSGKQLSSSEDLGAEYTLDLLTESSLEAEQILELLNYTSDLGMVPLCTPWDINSFSILAHHGMPAYKVASADLTNHPLLKALASDGKPLLVSTGMSTENEIRSAVDVLRQTSCEYGLLHCQSSYPPAERDLNLNYISRLAELGDCIIGYSSHERGYVLTVAAVALGARIIEKHITLDRSARGVDHVVSLEPADFGEMVRQIRLLEEALGSASPRDLTQGERLNRLALAKSLVAARDMAVGQVLEAEDISVRAPGRGIQPNRQGDLLGKTLTRSMAEGDFFFETDLVGGALEPRSYNPGRPWGLPVRFHDWEALSATSNPDFLEFHLSYRDLESDFRNTIPEEMDYSLVVHSPDLFADDHILDLASSSELHRRRSVDALQRVLDLTNEMQDRFLGGRMPQVVASLGGSSQDEPIPRSKRPGQYERISSSIEMLDLGDVTLLAQTLPPFPWYLGGQRFCNLFVEPEETASFAEAQGLGLCLDIAHTKLACNHLRVSFSEAIEILAPLSPHLHLVDAAGLDREGLQIGDGEVDWHFLIAQLGRLTPNASFIPEIWQGHVDSGRGFWIAMDRLEPLMVRDLELRRTRSIPGKVGV